MRKLQVKVYRFDPLTDISARFDIFEVPAEPHWTVMDVLDYINIHQDSTVAYFKHTACDHGICGRCAVNVNGRVKLACSAEVSDEKVLELKPVNKKVIRDLVVEN